jgi:hypothetical protein
MEILRAQDEKKEGSKLLPMFLKVSRAMYENKENT